MNNDYYAWPEVISNWVNKATVAIAESMNEALKEALNHWELNADNIIRLESSGKLPFEISEDNRYIDFISGPIILARRDWAESTYHQRVDANRWSDHLVTFSGVVVALLHREENRKLVPPDLWDEYPTELERDSD